MDWNPVVHILDELRDGAQPFAVMRHMMSRYARASFIETLVFLADRELIVLSADADALKPIAKSERQRLLRGVADSDTSGPAASTSLWIDLSKNGEQVLSLFGIGGP